MDKRTYGQTNIWTNRHIKKGKMDLETNGYVESRLIEKQTNIQTDK